MPTQTHPIDVPATRALIAAFILIVGFGVLALTGTVPMQVPSTDDVAQFGD
jgi:hypothetical protein